MGQITITPAMVRALERSTKFEYGIEINGHPSTLCAMERRGLIRTHLVGGTLTQRGLWLHAYLHADGERRSFTPAEMDG